MIISISYPLELSFHAFIAIFFSCNTWVLLIYDIFVHYLFYTFIMKNFIIEILKQLQ